MGRDVFNILEGLCEGYVYFSVVFGAKSQNQTKLVEVESEAAIACSLLSPWVKAK